MKNTKAYESFLAFSKKTDREYLNGYPDVYFREMSSEELNDAKKLLSSKSLNGDSTALMALFYVDEEKGNLVGKEIISDTKKSGLSILTASMYLYRNTQEKKYLEQGLKFLKEEQEHLILACLSMLKELTFDSEGRSTASQLLKKFILDSGDLVHRHAAAQILLDQFEQRKPIDQKSTLKKLISDDREERASALGVLE